jgi:hypothetical protein
MMWMDGTVRISHDRGTRMLPIRAASNESRVRKINKKLKVNQNQSINHDFDF